MFGLPGLPKQPLPLMPGFTETSFPSLLESSLPKPPSLSSLLDYDGSCQVGGSVKLTNSQEQVFPNVGGAQYHPFLPGFGFVTFQSEARLAPFVAILIYFFKSIFKVEVSFN